MFENRTILTDEIVNYLADLALKAPVINVAKGLFAVGGLLFSALAYVRLGQPTFMAFAVVAVGCFCMALFGLTYLLKRKMLKSVRVGEARIYSIAEDGVTVTIPVDSERAAWNRLSFDRFDKLVVGETTLALHLGKGKSFLIMDKDGFTKGTLEECVAFLKSKGIKAE